MQSHLLDQALIVLPCEGHLVNVISRRVRQLANGHRPVVLIDPGMGFADVALTELIAGNLNFERTQKFVPEPIHARHNEADQTDGLRSQSSASPDSQRA